MNFRKAISLILLSAMLCMALAGCMYVDSETTVRDDGSGTVSFAAGLLADEGEEPEEGQEVFEANGNKYYGTREEYAFASVEEFNKLFTPDEEFNKLFTPDGEGAISGNSGAAFTLRKNADGSLMLVYCAVSEDGADETDETDETSEAYDAAMQEMLDGMEDTMYVVYSFSFEKPVLQLQGATDTVSIEGGKLTLDLSGQLDSAEGDVRVFVTDVPATVKPTRQSLTVNGEPKDTEIYNINGSNYFKLRDIAALLDGTDAAFSVDYDAVNRCIAVKKGEAYQAAGGELEIPEAEEALAKSAGAVRSRQALTIDGEAAYFAPYNIGGNNYFALRELGDALGFGVDYDAKTATMLITTGE